MTEQAVRPRTGSAIGIVLLWHAAVVVAFLIWVATWPEQLRTSQYFSMPRGFAAFLIGVIYLGPALGISLCVACLSMLPMRKIGSPLLTGTAASWIGFAVVAAATTVYALTR